VCGGKLTRREVDVEAAIRVRLANYHFMTEPLERYYREKGALLMLKGDQSIDYVHETLMKKLARLGFTP
jgi:adenylate kinase